MTEGPSHDLWSHVQFDCFSIGVWHDDLRVGRIHSGVFLGEVRLPLSPELQSHTAWYGHTLSFLAIDKELRAIGVLSRASGVQFSSQENAESKKGQSSRLSRPNPCLVHRSQFLTYFRYFLQPRSGTGGGGSASESPRAETETKRLGSLRLRITYTAHDVFSTRHYQPMRELLLKSPRVKVRQERSLMNWQKRVRENVFCFSLCIS